MSNQETKKKFIDDILPGASSSGLFKFLKNNLTFTSVAIFLIGILGSFISTDNKEIIKNLATDFDKNPESLEDRTSCVIREIWNFDINAIKKCLK